MCLSACVCVFFMSSVDEGVLFAFYEVKEKNKTEMFQAIQVNGKMMRKLFHLKEFIISLKQIHTWLFRR